MILLIILILVGGISIGTAWAMDKEYVTPVAITAFYVVICSAIITFLIKL